MSTSMAASVTLRRPSADPELRLDLPPGQSHAGPQLLQNPLLTLARAVWTAPPSSSSRRCHRAGCLPADNVGGDVGERAGVSHAGGSAGSGLASHRGASDLDFGLRGRADTHALAEHHGRNAGLVLHGQDDGRERLLTLAGIGAAIHWFADRFKYWRRKFVPRSFLHVALM